MTVEKVTGKKINIFRDVKPENFVLGLKDGENFNMIHMIDFGLATTYVDIKGDIIKIINDDILIKLEENGMIHFSILSN